MILDEIAEKTRERAAAARQRISLEDMKTKAEGMNTDTGFPGLQKRCGMLMT